MAAHAKRRRGRARTSWDPVSALRREGTAEGPRRNPREVQDGSLEEGSAAHAFVRGSGVDSYGGVEGVSDGAALVSSVSQSIVALSLLERGFEG